ncbi:MAG: HIT family protein [Chthonomonas sp.]|nr:HIT family protein [Chthonomonas sp.]
MALHQIPCELCDQLILCRDGSHPRLISEMESGFAVLGPSQYFYGYSLLICKEPATELDELEPLFRKQYLDDMARLAQAVRLAVRPNKLNTEALGNVCHHHHWHVFPRYLNEPEPLLPVWQCMPTEDEAAEHLFDRVRHEDLIQQIRRRLRD